MNPNLTEKRRKLNENLSYRNISQAIRKWITTNTRTKIWIFVFTVFLWLYVVLNNTYSYNFSAKLEVRNIDPTKTTVEKLPSQIQASFSGKGIDLFYLILSPQQSIKFVVDCSSIKRFYDFPLNEYFKNNPEKVITPRRTNVQLDHIIWPETLRVVLDDLLTAKVPVKPVVEIQLAPGYVLADSMRIIPDSVTLSGPRTYVRQYNKVPTKKLVLTNVSSSISQEIDLEFVPEHNVYLDVKRVRIQQKVDQLGEKKLTNIPVRVTNLGQDQKAEIIPPTATLTVSGGIEKLKTVRPEDIKIVFDFARDWRPDESFYTPTVELPPGLLNWQSLEPDTFEIRIIRERQP
ncbi:MAG TPA: CdaR family protein [Candidatus Marinimicrobia bacterium]|nr:CdaR family protein [Candidatus Neomarinimicrobiota bacterium]HRS51652.1 CdaR family protein [Candidatus Neomarinimicrobiota bacterium]HRU92198.1 CdaR family protein [Candidatus Neomarinimicrobiota bacterium]